MINLVSKNILKKNFRDILQDFLFWIEVLEAFDKCISLTLYLFITLLGLCIFFLFNNTHKTNSQLFQNLLYQ